MAQEFIIKSQDIEDKVNQLLPSQGGFQAGVDFSASTMVVPIIDLTETAEGSVLRQDLQIAFSHNTITNFSTVNATNTILSTTGYYRVFGTATAQGGGGTTQNAQILINDGSSTKIAFDFTRGGTSSTTNYSNTFDFIVKLEAGDSLQSKSSGTGVNIAGAVRQIADLSGNLVNP